MKQINLLPLDIRERAGRQQIVPFLVLSVLVAAAAAGLVWFTLHESISLTANDIKHRQNEQQQQAAADTKTQLANAVSPALQNKITQLNTLTKTDVDWLRAFSYVGQLTPQDIYLSGYGFTTIQGVLTLKTSGSAPSNLSFAQFMESLRTSARVKPPKVDAFAYDPVKGGVAFSVSWQVPFDQVQYIK